MHLYQYVNRTGRNPAVPRSVDTGLKEASGSGEAEADPVDVFRQITANSALSPPLYLSDAPQMPSLRRKLPAGGAPRQNRTH